MTPLQNTRELKPCVCVSVQRPRRKQDTQTAETMKISFIKLHQCASHSSRDSGNTISQESYIDVIIPILKRWKLRLSGPQLIMAETEFRPRSACFQSVWSPCTRQERPCFWCGISRKPAWLVVFELDFEDWMGF